MKGLIFFALFSANAFALDAVVTVLEAPLFKYKSVDAPVVMYKRKGDIISIHPSVANERRFDGLAPSKEKLKAVRKKRRETPEYNEDELFRGEKANSYTLQDEFIPLLDRQGKEVYILSSHIYVYFEDERELTQEVSAYDPTEYRIQEPLPDKYPIIQPSGYRGEVTLGFTQPYSESYPYRAKARTKGYSNPVDFNITLLRAHPKDKQDQLYWGGNFQVKYYENSFSFNDGFSAQEKATKIGLGPYIAYDAFKGVKHRLNLFGVVNFYLFNQLNISQSTPTGNDTRNYRTFSLSPKFGLQYHRKQVLKDLDFVIGTAVEYDPPSRFAAQDGARLEALWQNTGTDIFTTRSTLNLSGFLGFQSAY